MISPSSVRAFIVFPPLPARRRSRRQHDQMVKAPCEFKVGTRLQPSMRDALQTIEFVAGSALACAAAAQAARHPAGDVDGQLRHARHRQRPVRAPRRGPGGQARQVGAGGRQGPAARRRLGPHRHHPVQDAARDGAQPVRLARARLLRPRLPGQAGHRRSATWSRGCTRRSTTRSRCWSTSSCATRVRSAARRPPNSSTPTRSSLTTETGEHSEVGFDHALIAVGTRPHRPRQRALRQEARLRQRRDPGARPRCRAR